MLAFNPLSDFSSKNPKATLSDQQAFHKEYMTSTEAMQILGISRAGFLYGRRSGKLPEPLASINGRLIVWKRNEIIGPLLAWKQARKTSGLVLTTRSIEAPSAGHQAHLARTLSLPGSQPAATMDFHKFAIAIADDLKRVAKSLPNEKLPKEEQVRSCLYAELRPESEAVCVERGYASHESQSTIEVDLWVRHATGTDYWIEIKRFWHVSAPGWVHKPDEQLKNWRADLDKLAKVSLEDNRIFVLVGFLTIDPGIDLLTIKDGAIHRMNHLYPSFRCHHSIFPFEWRDSPVRSVSISVWKWRRGEAITQ